MPDLKAALTEALRAAHYRIVGGSSDCRVDPGEVLADVLLALPGVAVIQLPEPTATDDDGQAFFGEYDIRVDLTGRRVDRTVTTDFCQGSEFKMSFSPTRARWWAEHLLAAAVLSEGEAR